MRGANASKLRNLATAPTSISGGKTGSTHALPELRGLCFAFSLLGLQLEKLTPRLGMFRILTAPRG